MASLVVLAVAYCGEAFATDLAAEGALARMGPHVYLKVPLLPEQLPTPNYLALPQVLFRVN
jgi:hypothetical protein